MTILVVPMFALSRMGGPWGRAQAIAAAFESAGHHVVLGIADDGNCIRPCVADTCKLPVPSPLGLPKGISSRTFPIASKLGIAGRKPVNSFEEVLWLTGALAYAYERESVSAICDIIEKRCIDAVYSEFSLPAIIAAHALDVPVFGSFSFTTQASYASTPAKAGGVRKLLGDLGLVAIESALDLFDWLDLRFVPSCPELEPIEDAKTKFVSSVICPKLVKVSAIAFWCISAAGRCLSRKSSAQLQRHCAISREPYASPVVRMSAGTATSAARRDSISRSCDRVRAASFTMVGKTRWRMLSHTGCRRSSCQVACSSAYTMRKASSGSARASSWIRLIQGRSPTPAAALSLTPRLARRR